MESAVIHSTPLIIRRDHYDPPGFDWECVLEWLPVPDGLASPSLERKHHHEWKKWDQGLTDFFLLCSFFSFLPPRCTLMENSHPPPSYRSPFSILFISYLSPPLSFSPACLSLCYLHLCSLFLGNCSPLARALLWSRPPSSCFLNPPAEWVSDWPRERREERE